MPQPDYKDYNNYSQRDKESMRTAAADASVTAEQALVTQTDGIVARASDFQRCRIRFDFVASRD